mmetsp:Transcript_6168/g.16786  ORF Transcript_6168/g.16786 Transcript_6168/m.16786 type:complete len:91 (-) Transcript_6168:941-1213(-)
MAGSRGRMVVRWRTLYDLFCSFLLFLDPQLRDDNESGTPEIQRSNISFTSKSSLAFCAATTLKTQTPTTADAITTTSVSTDRPLRCRSSL